MEHDIPFGNSNRENGTTFLDFPLFLGIFQLDEPTKRVPFTAEPEIPEILTKWKAPINSWARLSDVPGHRDVTAKWGVRRAEFSKMAVLLFFMWTLWAYFFPCHEAAMWFLFWSRIPLPYIPTEEVSAFWLLRENSAKKVSEGFRWVSKLGKLCECGATFRSTKTRFSLDKKHEKTCSFAPK